LLNNFFRPAIFHIHSHVLRLIHNRKQISYSQNQTECSNNREKFPSVIPFLHMRNEFPANNNTPVTIKLILQINSYNSIACSGKIPKAIFWLLLFLFANLFSLNVFLGSFYWSLILLTC
jgi:hypothetical protein